MDTVVAIAFLNSSSDSHSVVKNLLCNLLLKIPQWVLEGPLRKDPVPNTHYLLFPAYVPSGTAELWPLSKLFCLQSPPGRFLTHSLVPFLQSIQWLASLNCRESSVSSLYCSDSAHALSLTAEPGLTAARTGPCHLHHLTAHVLKRLRSSQAAVLLGVACVLTSISRHWT